MPVPEDTLSGFDPLAGLAIAPVAFVLSLPFGPLAEELGWRGYAQPRLMGRHGLWKTSLIIGVIWTFWHIPMFWFPGATFPSYLDPDLPTIALYCAQITAEAGVLTFLYVMTRGSVLPAVLYHAAFNTAETIVFRMTPDPTVDQEYQVYVISIALTWALAVVLLTVAGRRVGRWAWRINP